jgi:hypothetical protein
VPESELPNGQKGDNLPSVLEDLLVWPGGPHPGPSGKTKQQKWGESRHMAPRLRLSKVREGGVCRAEASRELGVGLQTQKALQSWSPGVGGPLQDHLKCGPQAQARSYTAGQNQSRGGICSKSCFKLVAKLGLELDLGCFPRCAEPNRRAGFN